MCVLRQRAGNCAYAVPRLVPSPLHYFRRPGSPPAQQHNCVMWSAIYGGYGIAIIYGCCDAFHLETVITNCVHKTHLKKFTKNIYYFILISRPPWASGDTSFHGVINEEY